MKDKITELIRSLGLLGMAEVIDREMASPERQGSPAGEVIERLLEAEYQYRQGRSLAYRLRQARIPYDWTLDTFPFERQPGVNKSRILSLAGLSFVERADNIVLIGDTGTGKTGLAIGLLREAIVNGYRGCFYDAQNILDDLYASLADRATPKLIKRLCRYDILVIDEMGYLTLKPEQVNAFFKLIEGRYSRKTTIITTYLDYQD